MLCRRVLFHVYLFYARRACCEINRSGGWARWTAARTDLGGDEGVEREAQGEVDEAEAEREPPEGHAVERGDELGERPQPWMWVGVVVINGWVGGTPSQVN